MARSRPAPWMTLVWIGALLLLLASWLSRPNGRTNTAAWSPWSIGRGTGIHGQGLPLEFFRVDGTVRCWPLGDVPPDVSSRAERLAEARLLVWPTLRNGTWGLTYESTSLWIEVFPPLSPADSAALPNAVLAGLDTVVSGNRTWPAHNGWDRAAGIIERGRYAPGHPVPPYTGLSYVYGRALWTGYAFNVVSILLALTVLGLTPFVIAFARRAEIRRKRARRGLCLACAYDLRHDYATGCSECGWNRSATPQ